MLGLLRWALSQPCGAIDYRIRMADKDRISGAHHRVREDYAWHTDSFSKFTLRLCDLPEILDVIVSHSACCK